MSPDVWTSDRVAANVGMKLCIMEARALSLGRPCSNLRPGHHSPQGKRRMSEVDTFFVKYRATVTGPHTRDKITAMVEEGSLTPVHRISVDHENWQPLHRLAGWHHLWTGPGRVIEHTSGATTEPPPLPCDTHRGLATAEALEGLRAAAETSDDNRDEPLDVELLD